MSVSAAHTAVHAIVCAAGASATLLTLASAVRTVVLPRGVTARLGRVVFLLTRQTFRLAAGRAASYERRDRVFALYAPTSLMVLLQVWLLMTLAGCAAMFWGLDAGGVRQSITLSGSSLLTLGFKVPHGGPQTAVCFAEAALGLTLLALLITYLPSLYTSFSRREQTVAKLEVRAGSPPTGAEMVWRSYVLQRQEVLAEAFVEWESWFVDIEETHLSFPMLVFFRSPQPDRSWVTAAGAVLDAAALMTSSLDGPRLREAQLTLRAGYIALRRIAGYYQLPAPVDPQRGDAITVTRDEFEEALDRIASSGAPVREDREAAWLDFSGWRVNYDVALVGLAALTQAPYAPWSSDRSLSGIAARPTRLSRLRRNA